MNALIYQSNHNKRFGAALGAAAIIHVAAIGFATTNHEPPPVAAGKPGGPFVEMVLPPDPAPNPDPVPSAPLLTPPVINQFYVENTATPPPVRTQQTKFLPVVRRTNSAGISSLNLSSAKVLALNAPRPEYPYEARRQKITGDGVAVMNVDPSSGNVTNVTMAKSTGSAFLDNAAIAGFRRWRFKPGSVSSVTCPVTFTLNGASY